MHHELCYCYVILSLTWLTMVKSWNEKAYLYSVSFLLHISEDFWGPWVDLLINLLHNFPHLSMWLFKLWVGQTCKSNWGHHKLFTAQNTPMKWFIGLGPPSPLGLPIGLSNWPKLCRWYHPSMQWREILSQWNANARKSVLARARFYICMSKRYVSHLHQIVLATGINNEPYQCN